MALEFASGVITSPTSATTKSVTGLSFQPKVLILFSVMRTGTATTSIALTDAEFMCGFAVDDDSTTRQACSHCTSQQGGAASQRTVRNDKVLYTTNVSGTVYEAATVSAWNSDGFTLNFSNALGSVNRYGYVCLGGDDITDVYVDTVISAATAGESTYASPGFQPDLLLLGSAWQASVPNSSGADLCNLGAATSDTEQMCVSQFSKLALTTVTGRGSSSDQIVDQYWDDAQWIEGDITEFNTSGFKIDWTTLPGSAQYFPFLAIKGPQFKVASFTSKTGSTGTLAVTGAGFAPVGLLCLSSQQAVADWNTHVAHSNISAGYGSSGSDGHCFIRTSKDANSYGSPREGETVQFLSEFDPSTGSNLADANIDSLDSDGFTLNWTDIDGTQRQHIYVAMGNAAAGGESPNLMMGVGM